MTLWMRPRAFLCLLLLLASQASHAQYTGLAGTVVRFATVAQGRELLGRDDAWVAATSDFQRAATVARPSPVTSAQLLAFTVDTVRPWTAADEARWRRALDVIAPRFAALHVPLPSEVFLINTDGRDAANAPYTRGRAVVLPMSALAEGSGPRADVVLLAHELFHVVSRHNPALSTRLYATIGFESVAPLQWPAAWLPARIANPDAPFDRHAMRVSIEGRSAQVMPLLVARRTDLKADETFFDVLDVRLLEVSLSASGATLPVLRAGQPVWHEPAQVPEYLKKLGGNTAYIIHPEETMADNFALLVAKQTVPNQALLDRIEGVLLEAR